MSGRSAMPMPSRSTGARCAIRERAVGLDHPETATSTNNLAYLLRLEDQHRRCACRCSARLIAGGRAQPRVALPVLFDARQKDLLPPGTAFDDALNVVQRGAQSSAASAVNKLAVRLGRRQRPPRRTRAPGPGSGLGSRAARQVDHDGGVEGPHQARSGRRAARPRADFRDRRRARQAAEDAVGGIPRLFGAVESAAADGRRKSSRCCRRRSDGAVRARREGKLRLRASRATASTGSRSRSAPMRCRTRSPPSAAASISRRPAMPPANQGCSISALANELYATLLAPMEPLMQGQAQPARRALGRAHGAAVPSARHREACDGDPGQV